ncbi:inter-alpha-trypsin inhibitor heavy chain H4-like isoform X2 [Bacillus rossius redtenbacheri]|uniref:inter-alpha-trypsin inhibitor heavy chain H4-like isoform X2 n=1 Tax=Bacillus rossius redtenbacheri TaxID=93214 RepID=UPI002FDDFA70
MLAAWLVLVLALIAAAARGELVAVSVPVPVSTTPTTAPTGATPPTAPTGATPPTAPTGATPPPLNSSAQSGGPEVYSLHITSRIQHRYASTLVSSRVANRAASAREIYFSFVMPETAFISGFLMEIAGVAYKAHVKEKEEAKREYNEAVSQGRAAAHVAQSARNSNRFVVSVNIEPTQKVTFNLTYEELLKRDLSYYTHAINIDPGQIVPDLTVEVYINESSPIRSVQVPTLRESNEIDADNSLEADPLAEIELSPGRAAATVRWAPSKDQQKALRAQGVKGQLAVRYDLDRTSRPQQILVNEGYFVHFFAPEALPPLPKHVVFVVDVSGSMYGRKIEQLRDAMARILSDLAPHDYFSLLTFSTNVQVWDLENPLAIQHENSFEVVRDDSEPRNTSVVAATIENINKAKEFTSRLSSYSSTNIYDALMKGLRVAQLGRTLTRGGAEPMIIFLTDGEANVGESEPGAIVASVSDANSARVAIFSLAFGDYADLQFLRRLSLRNSGFARKIYEASDAALQLRDFYRQVASPLLANVSFEYANDEVDTESLSTTTFSALYRGSELVVCGRLRADSLAGVVTARGANGSYVDPSSSIVLGPVRRNSTPSSMERLWGYMTIQQLLERDTAGTGNSSALRARALELALRYSFVTALTSLVVVKPNETSSADVEEGGSPGYENSPPSMQAPLHYLPRTGGVSYHSLNYPVPLSISSVPPPGLAIIGPMSGLTDAMDWSAMEMAMVTSSVPPQSTGPRLVSLDSLTWLNRTGNLTSVTLQLSGAHVTLLVETTNQTNVAHGPCDNTVTGGPGHCRHLLHCALDQFQDSAASYQPYLCVLGSYAGVCCPDSLQPVAAQLHT